MIFFPNSVASTTLLFLLPAPEPKHKDEINSMNNIHEHPLVRGR